MRILHTSDWHLGRALYGRKRYAEFAAFLEWLGDLLEKEHIDVLLVAGDVFDTTTPSNRAQELYYRFLHRVARSACGHVVITAGNHDSPSFLNAPRDLLRQLQIYVVGSIEAEVADEVLLLRDSRDRPLLLVAAVPYLRDRDIRTVEPGESPDDKNRKLIQGIRNHYAQAGQQVQELLNRLEERVPVIAMGHLFAAGGRTVEGDGVRELYVGSLAHVGTDIFPETFDYVALGHLHTPQTVGGQEKYRYSGAPLPMTFQEASRPKQVVMLEIIDGIMDITPLNVPLFRTLVTVRGDYDQVCAHLEVLKQDHTQAWVEIFYEGTEIIGDLRQQLDEIVRGTGLDILRVNNNRRWDREMSLLDTGELLSELNIVEVFRRCLDDHQVEESQREDLLQIYNEVVLSIYKQDEAYGEAAE